MKPGDILEHKVSKTRWHIDAVGSQITMTSTGGRTYVMEPQYMEMYRPYVEGRRRKNQLYTTKEIDYIIEHYPLQTKEEIAEKLGRTVSSVSGCINKLRSKNRMKGGRKT